MRRRHGFWAVVLRAFPDAKLVPLGHGCTDEELQIIVEEITPDTTVYTVDCAIGVEECIASDCQVITIDHHRGMHEELMLLAEQHENYTFVFNNEKSGSSLSWSYFSPK